MRPVMLELARQYQETTGQTVEINSAGSGELLAQIELKRTGDLYVCHDPFLDLLMNKFRMGTDGWTVAHLRPVIMVAKGNPKNVAGMKDLARPDLRLALTDLQHSTLGWMLPTIFDRAGMDLPALMEEKHVAMNKSGGYVANLVATGNADAALAWNAVAWLRRDAVDILPLPDSLLPDGQVDAMTSATGRTFMLTPVRVTIATLSCSSQPDAARNFAQFVASEQAAAVFADFGFTACPAVKEYEAGRALTPGHVRLSQQAAASADRTADQAVTLRMYAGAGLRPAVDDLVAAFKRETGIAVEVEYGGSGIILSRARQDAQADLFMPGEMWYVDRLQELADTVQSKTIVAWLVPVIAVAKGNPKQIKSVKDLFRDDVSVALGRADANQVGRISGEILALNGLDRAKLRCKESLTVNELGVWVKMRDVDAAIVWDALAANYADAVDAVSIPKDKNVISQAGLALLKTSQHAAEAGRFVAFATGEQGRTILQQKGYRTEAP